MTLFIDVSSFQNPADLLWDQYRMASAAGDGISRILLRIDQGVGVKDSAVEVFWAAAVANGIDSIGFYHYAYPNLHPGITGAQAEAQSMEQLVGARLRPNDFIMLDLEQNESSAWALYFGLEMQKWHPVNTKPVVYDSLSRIAAYLTDPALVAVYDLAIADWTFDPNSRPAAPAPWPSYRWLQYTDRLTAPWYTGGPVDANVYTGEIVMVPAGWTDNGSAGLTAPNGIDVPPPFSDYIRGNVWSSDNLPLAPAAHLESIEDGNPSIGPGMRQDFRMSSLAASDNDSQGGPAHQPYLVWIGQDRLALLAEVAALKAQPPQGEPLADAAKAALRAWLA